jgi:uncharacterized DUF497 family protein
MKFEWDENKNQLNIRKHGIDFHDVIRIISARKATANEKSTYTKRLRK